MMKINVGCGPKKMEGYINIDINPDVKPDFVTSADVLDFCGDGEADEIMMSAVYEHLYETERYRALEEWARCMRKGGLLKILWIPDAEVAAQEYVTHCVDVSLYGKCVRKVCGPVAEFPHWDIEMFERVTSGAKGLHNEMPYQVHKSIFSRQKVMDEVSKFGLFKVSYCTNETYPGEVGAKYNICLSAVRL